MKPFSWQCPYCGHHSTITDRNFHSQQHGLSIENAHGPKVLFTYYIVCPNEECNEYVLTAVLNDSKHGWHEGTIQHYDIEETQRWRLIPNSYAKVFPEYIPLAIRQDYEEACAIQELSPKASATLSRRCLQGMIRDYWKVTKPRLVDEIEAVKDRVDPLTWSSIDAVRKVGNIGAHMEKDINMIVDVEPNEAGLLINLIEILVKDWYVARHSKQAMLNEIVALAGSKEAARSGETTQAATA